jgi:hypothetical protein
MCRRRSSKRRRDLIRRFETPSRSTFTSGTRGLRIRPSPQNSREKSAALRKGPGNRGPAHDRCGAYVLSGSGGTGAGSTGVVWIGQAVSSAGGIAVVAAKFGVAGAEAYAPAMMMAMASCRRGRCGGGCCHCCHRHDRKNLLHLYFLRSCPNSERKDRRLVPRTVVVEQTGARGMGENRHEKAARRSGYETRRA